MAFALLFCSSRKFRQDAKVFPHQEKAKCQHKKEEKRNSKPTGVTFATQLQRYICNRVFKIAFGFVTRPVAIRKLKTLLVPS